MDSTSFLCLLIYLRILSRLNVIFYLSFASAQVLQNLLITWRKNHDKVLIFSGSLKLLDMLKMLINGAGYSFVSLDGHVKKVEERKLEYLRFILLQRLTAFRAYVTV